jgi:mRNA-degrading endonuclease toxin of MazEF toxin-antitoxin module
VANQGNNTVSVLSLGTAIDPIQIVEASPAITSTSSSNLTLTVNGSGFPASSVVRLDQVRAAPQPRAHHMWPAPVQMPHNVQRFPQVC